MPASVLAEELGVSLRTVYRDIATLAAQGASIVGEAGVGYVLRPGDFLPPLMFAPDEVDALLLGLQLVARRGDPGLERGASDALAKIAAVLPRETAERMDGSGILAGPAPARDTTHLPVIRQALREERKLALRYADRHGAATARLVWPVALGFFEAAEVLAAWCELRGDFRHFRLDRIQAAELPGDAMPRRRLVLLAEWRALQGA